MKRKKNNSRRKRNSSRRVATATQPDVLSRKEELILALATVHGVAPELASEEQIQTVVDWAIDTRWGQMMFELVLDGHLVPAGKKKNGELGFRSATNAPPTLGASGPLLSIRGPEDIEARLINAARVGAEIAGLPSAEPLQKSLCEWVDKLCRDMGHLAGLLDGTMLAVPGDPITFRPSSELSPDQLDALRHGLEEIDRKYKANPANN